MNIVINIDVPDLAAAIRFYTAALGLTHTRTLDDDVEELSGATATIYLLQKTGGSRSAPAPHLVRDYSRHWTPVHFDLVVYDAEAAASRAIEAGAVRESGQVEWRGSRCVSLSDPFGHGFCFIQFERKGTYD